MPPLNPLDLYLVLHYLLIVAFIYLMMALVSKIVKKTLHVVAQTARKFPSIKST